MQEIKTRKLSVVAEEMVEEVEEQLTTHKVLLPLETPPVE